MEEIEGLLKALADKNRIRILKLLEVRKMCVCELAFVLGITQPAVSRHLKKLASAGIIASEQDCFWTNYHLKYENNPLRKFLSCFNKHLGANPIIKRDRKKLAETKRDNICR